MAGAPGGRGTRAHVIARWATVLVGLACAAIAWLAASADGAISAGLATIIVVGFMWSGIIPLSLTDRAKLGAGAGLTVLLLTYTLRLAMVLVVLRLLSSMEFVDRRWLGVTVIACALTWTAVHLRVGMGRGRDA